MKRIVPIALIALLMVSPVLADSSVPVTVDNFPRAESDLYMSKNVNEVGLAKFQHIRTPVDIDKQMVIRMNRDTLYSSAVFDLDAGPATITMPDAGKRFMSLQVISEDHYVPAVFYGPGSHTLTKDQVGTRYVLIAVRTLVDPSDPKDLDQVHALQDAAIEFAHQLRPVLERQIVRREINATQL